MIKYNIISRKNPLTKEYAFYASALPVNPIALDEIAEEISGKCTVTSHNIKAVLSALEEVTFKHLRNGNSIRLGLSSSGAATVEEFSPDNLRGIKVRFLPSSKLRFELSRNMEE